MADGLWWSGCLAQAGVETRSAAQSAERKSIKKTDFSASFASLTTVEMTSFQQSNYEPVQVVESEIWCSKESSGDI